MRFEVIEYTAEWPKKFIALKDRYAIILRDINYTSIEHIGSTSVPGLASKDIIDLDVIIPLSNELDASIAALTAAGCRYIGEQNIPGRYCFRQPPEATIRHNLYVCVEGSVALRNHLGFRDVLRNDDQLRREYAAVKLGLAEKEFDHIGQYADGKSEILHKILARSGLSEEELDGIRNANTQGLNWKPTPP